MADKQLDEIVDLVIKRLGIKREEVEGILEKRKKKWRRRWLKEDKEEVTLKLVDIGQQLVARRHQGLEEAKQLQAQESNHCLEVFVSVPS